MRSCFQREISDWVIGVAVGVLVQFICGYVTLPLYALVAQASTKFPCFHRIEMGVHILNVGYNNGVERWGAR